MKKQKLTESQKDMIRGFYGKPYRRSTTLYGSEILTMRALARKGLVKEMQDGFDADPEFRLTIDGYRALTKLLEEREREARLANFMKWK